MILRPTTIRAARFALCNAALLLSLSTLTAHAELPRPNILWITAEDLSPVLGCYGDSDATTPNIDALAGESVRYDNAFAVSPVCSASRTCLINGVLGTTLGTHHMRNNSLLPTQMRGFPALLRKAGYYTSNNFKTDYNTGSHDDIVRESWNDSSETAHWRNRRSKDQPFFAVFNLMESHQSRSMVWPYEKFQSEIQSQLTPSEIHSPDSITLPPYYPDTPIIRKTVARFFDCVTVMDKKVGKILKQLEDDGLKTNTIVFFYGDHGSGMPRHKRALLDSGMRVPLTIRYPARFRNLNAEPNPVTDRVVSFVDYAPTVLSLAGVKIPDYMQGIAFAGRDCCKPRQYAYGHRDRVDEVSDLARSVRDKRYLYIRNYMPHLSYNQRTAWPDQGKIRHEFYRLTDKSKLTPAQWHFVSPTRPIEELYDCENDPLNLKNLADEPSSREVIVRMRAAHIRWIQQSRDLGFMAEIEQQKAVGQEPPYEWAQNYDVLQLQNAAEQVGTQDETTITKMMADGTPSVRYWAAMAVSALRKPSPQILEKTGELLNDRSTSVQIEAALALCRHDNSDGLKTIERLLGSEDPWIVLFAARSAELMGSQADSLEPKIRAINEKHKNALTNPAGPLDPPVSLFLTTTAYLKHRQSK